MDKNILLSSMSYNSVGDVRLEAEKKQPFEAADSDPILSKADVLSILTRAYDINLTIHDELELDCPLTDSITFYLSKIEEGGEDIAHFHISNSLKQMPIIKVLVKGHPDKISSIDQIYSAPDSTFFRLVWGNSNRATLHMIKNRAQYIGEYLSRGVSIFGSDSTNRKILADRLNVKTTPTEFYQTTYSDKVFENIRKSHFVIVGGGTVGMVAGDSLTRIGASRITYFELPDEESELPNGQRLPGHGSEQLGIPKWRTFLNLMLNNNPFADISYLGAFDDGKDQLKSSWIRKVMNQKFEQAEGPVYVILALDQMKHRAYAHHIFKDSAYARLSPTDIGNGSLLQVHTKGESFEIPPAKSPLHTIIKMLGGNDFAASNFDINTLKAFFGLGTGAYGAFPQAHTSAYTTGALLAAAVCRLAAGKPIPQTVFTDPALQLETNQMKNSAKRQEILRTMEA